MGSVLLASQRSGIALLRCAQFMGALLGWGCMPFNCVWVSLVAVAAWALPFVQVWMQLEIAMDFCNSFNTLHCDAVQAAVHERAPEPGSPSSSGPIDRAYAYSCKALPRAPIPCCRRAVCNPGGMLVFCLAL